LQPFAKNGAHVASNLALRCSAHNALAAEEDFGASFVADRRRSGRHEASRSIERVAPDTDLEPAQGRRSHAGHLA
jgi:hypothetical protein